MVAEFIDWLEMRSISFSSRLILVLYVPTSTLLNMTGPVGFCFGKSTAWDSRKTSELNAQVQVQITYLTFLTQFLSKMGIFIVLTPQTSQEDPKSNV